MGLGRGPLNSTAIPRKRLSWYNLRVPQDGVGGGRGKGHISVAPPMWPIADPTIRTRGGATRNGNIVGLLCFSPRMSCPLKCAHVGGEGRHTREGPGGA